MQSITKVLFLNSSLYILTISFLSCFDGSEVTSLSAKATSNVGIDKSTSIIPVFKEAQCRASYQQTYYSAKAHAGIDERSCQSLSLCCDVARYSVCCWIICSGSGTMQTHEDYKQKIAVA